MGGALPPYYLLPLPPQDCPDTNLESPRDDAEGIVKGSLGLIQHVLGGTTEDHCTGLSTLATREPDQLRRKWSVWRAGLVRCCSVRTGDEAQDHGGL